jgi:hypothetical protein
MATTGQLRKLLNGPGVIRSLGAHDVFTARLIEAAGLETVFLGGFGTSASLLGLPDIGTNRWGRTMDNDRPPIPTTRTGFMFRERCHGYNGRGRTSHAAARSLSSAAR